MRKFNALYYLLFILLVMGAFASMAQNGYGIKIMGGVAFALGLVFLVEFISLLGKKGEKDVYSILETLCLFLLAFIFGLRLFYLHFPYVEFIFGIAGVSLTLLYLRKMFNRFRQFQPKNSVLAGLIFIFHLSILLFLLSLAMIPFAVKMSFISGAAALAVLLCFLLIAAIKNDLMVDGEKISAFSVVRKFNDHSVIIVSLLILFSLYTGLNKIGILPGIYTDQFPKAYYELIERAALKKEKPVDGRYQHQDFKQEFDKFLRNVKKSDVD